MTMSIVALAAVAVLRWVLPDGSVATDTQELVPFEDGVRLELGRERMRAMNAKRLDIVPEFAHARKGESGYWFSPYGFYGEYDRDEVRFFAGSERMSMPMFGWSTPRVACLAVVGSLKYYVRETVLVEKGEYTVAATLEEELCRRPYEDLVIDYHLRPAGTSYADLAKIYRKRQLDRGLVRPFRERFAESKVLEKAIMAPEVRIRQAWKPVPSPVPHQSPESEPEVRAAVTFDRVKDIVRELKRQGVGDAELCLVGTTRWHRACSAQDSRTVSPLSSTTRTARSNARVRRSGRKTGGLSAQGDGHDGTCQTAEISVSYKERIV